MLTLSTYSKNRQSSLTRYGQFITTLFSKTVISSHEFRLWRVDWHPTGYPIEPRPHSPFLAPSELCEGVFVVVEFVCLLQRQGISGYQSTHYTVKSSHGHLVTRLTRHRSTLSHMRLISQSTSPHTHTLDAVEVVPSPTKTQTSRYIAEW